jgi:23S rRNA pseudouridine1911/1915/1917 synthase
MTRSRTPPPERWTEHTVTPDEAGRTLQELLTGPMAVSGRMIQRLTRSKGIRVNRKPGFLAARVRTGDVVAVRLAAPEEAGLEPEPMELSIVHEDADVMVLDKPAHVFVHPTAPGQHGTLAHGIAHHWLQAGLQAKVRPVHRLDRDTSGLVLVAKTAFAHQHLDRQLRERTLRRTYLAFVRGAPEGEAGTVDAPIGRHRANPNLRMVRPDGEPAVTHWRVVERYPAAALLQVELETGRTHQIRVHLAHLGHPVLGDRQYNPGDRAPVRRQALHASHLSFTHPATGERLELEAPLPSDLANLRDRLGASPHPDG